MTVGEIIIEIGKLRPGQELSLSEYLSHINRLERDIYSNIISCHEGSSEYTENTAESGVLLVPEMYAEIYKFYILAQIDLANGDVTRYTNNMILYNNLLSAYTDWYNRNHMPLQKADLRWC